MKADLASTQATETKAIDMGSKISLSISLF